MVLKKTASILLTCGFVRRADKLSIKSFIAPRGRIPRKIQRHCPFHQPCPEAPIAEDLPRAFDRVPESFARIFVTKKAVTAVVWWIVVFNDLLNSAGDARYWESAIFQ